MGIKADSVEVVIESSADKANAELDKMIAKLSQVESSMRNVKQNSFNGKAVKGIDSANNGLLSFTKNTKTATKSTKSLAASFGLFYANCFLFIRGIKALGKAIGSTMDYIETYNYFNVIMDKIGTEFSSGWEEAGYSSAEAYADSFRKRLTDLTGEMTGYKIGDNGGLYGTDSIGLGLDPEKLMNYQASIASITNAVGLCGDVSINTSKALSMLSADLSSLKNQDLDSVMTNLQSGLIGQSRALYKYGIDITNTTLQQYAFANGISKAVSEMTQSEKMQLRMIAILDQSKVSWGDMANTINGVANQYRMFKQQISNLARILGALFIPVIQKVLPYINAFTIALQRLLTWVGSLLGVDWTNLMSGISSGYVDSGLESIEDDTDDVTKALDNANEAAKKLKNTTLGIDELNINAPDDESGSSSNGKESGGGVVDLSGALQDALDEYQKVWDKAMSSMDNKAVKIANDIEEAFNALWNVAENTRNAIESLWNNGLSKLANFTWTALKDFWEKFLKPIGVWMLSDDSGLPRFFNITNDLLNKIDWEKLNEYLSKFFESLQKPTKFVWTALMDFYEKFLVPIATWTCNEAIPKFLEVLTKFNNSVDWKKLNESLSKFFASLEKPTKFVFDNILKFYEDFLEPIAEYTMNETLKTLLDTLTKFNNNVKWEKLTEKFDNLYKSIEKYFEDGSDKTCWIIDKFLEPMLEYSMNETIPAFLDDISEALNNISWYIEKVKPALEWLGQVYNKLNGGKTNENNNGILGFLKKLGNNLYLSGLRDTNTALGVLLDFSDKIDKIKSFINLCTQLKNITEVKISEWYKTEVEPWFSEELWNKIGENVKIIGKKLKEMITQWKTDIKNWWTTDVLPWFTVEKWKSATDGIKRGIQEKWKELTDWWNNTAIVKFWEKVKTDFGIDAWLKNIGSIKDALSQKWNEALAWWKDRPALKQITYTLDSIKEKLKEKWNAAIDWWNSKKSLSEVIPVIADIAKMLQNAWSSAKAWWDKNVRLSIPKLSLQVEYQTQNLDTIHTAIVKALGLPGWPSLKFFANGGFPEDGMFMANHGELVGKFSNGKTAVANNEQITSGIARAVESGVGIGNAEQTALLYEQNRLLRELLAKDNNTYLDGRKLTEETQKRSYRNGYQFSPA